MIPYGRQDVRDEDIAALTRVLQSDFLTQGPMVPQFENALKAVVGVRHAAAMCNATACLHIAYLALGLGSGDSLWTVPNTFVATANGALYCGANIDFVDIDPATYNMSVAALTAKLDRAAASGTLPKIVAPVHFGGQSCEMRPIHELATKYDFKVVEDASHAVGGRYLDQPVGNCRFSDIAVFSFHPVKIITTAEGGMATTNDADLAARMERLRTHGVTRDPVLMNGASEGPWYYQQIELGLNYRLTDIQAALGLSQLGRLAEYVERRRHLVRRYRENLAELPVTPQYEHPDAYSSYHLFPIWIDPARHSRSEIFASMRAAGIGVNVHYIPVHLQPYYRARGFRPGDFPNAEKYYAGAISLPMFPTLTESDQDRVIAALKRALA